MKFLLKKIVLIYSLLLLGPLHGHGRESVLQRDLNDWENINRQKWFSLNEWIKESQEKEKDIFYELRIMESRHKEKVGHIISCYGRCTLHQGMKFGQVHHETSIDEGDEFSTDKASYAWIFLLDGTLIRISPSTSISFNEIAISRSKIFFHTRINHGHVQWISRNRETLPLINSPETDPLFLPILPRGSLSSHLSFEKRVERNDPISSFLFPPEVNKLHREEVNKKITENNQYMTNKESLILIRTPVGDFYGPNTSISFYVTFGYETYFKTMGDIELSFRQRIKKHSVQPDKDRWYQINRYGKKITAYLEGDKLFAHSEILIKRPVSLFKAREELLEKYSKLLYSPDATYEGLLQQGHFLLDHPDNDIFHLQYFDFNKKITSQRDKSRYQEKSNLYSILFLVDKYKIEKIPFDHRFYQLAFARYLHYIAQENH